MQITEQKPHIAAPIKYCLYARKSSEEDERQALSIDSQLKEMRTLAEREKLHVTETRQESHSAKQSGERKVFMGLLEDIGAGKFDGILTWAPDRLSRNAGDLGKLVDLMDQGSLREIRTYGQRFANSPNEKFLLMILCSQAKLENDNRGLNVLRGLKNKVEMGWRPGLPPLGYLNEKSTARGQNKIFVDQERAPTVKLIFEKVSYEHRTGREIETWLHEIGFKTRGDKPPTLSMIYQILKNPFYHGEFEYPTGTGKWYKGLHESLITKELFDRVQEQLTAPERGAYGQKEFLFTRLFRCGSCGSAITAEEKLKKLKTDDTIRRYVYYRCTRKKDPNCREPYVREEELIRQIGEMIETMDLNKAAATRRFREELDQHRVLQTEVLGRKADDPTAEEADMRVFARYVFMKGAREEKRELLGCLNGQFRLKQGSLVKGDESEAQQSKNGMAVNKAKKDQ